MARFQPGNRDQAKRKNCRGGRPTREAAQEKKLKEDAARKIIEDNAEKLARRLVKDAMTEKGRKSLHVAINKLVSDAKQQTMDINLKSGFERLIQDLEEEERREAEEKAAREKDETIL